MIAEPKLTRLPIAALRRDGGTQIRVAISTAAVAEYAEAMVGGASFPPVSARHDGKTHWLTDGHHRVMAAEAADFAEIDVLVTLGDRRAAVLDALGANATHGIRRTNADKRHAVSVMLEDEEWRGKADREIARMCAVGPDLVGRLRPTVPNGERPTQAKREVTRGGRTYSMDVASINRQRAAPPPTQIEEPSAPIAGDDGAGERTASTAVLGSDLEEAVVASENVVHEPAEEPGSEEAAVAPALFDFSISAERDRIMQAIVTIANARPARETADAWSTYTGSGLRVDTVDAAKKWLSCFATLFPAAEAARQAAITVKLENL